MKLEPIAVCLLSLLSDISNCMSKAVEVELYARVYACFGRRTFCLQVEVAGMIVFINGGEAIV